MTPTCPFCPFSDADEQFVAQHIEYCHPETGAEPSEPSALSPADQAAILEAAGQDENSGDEDDSAEKYIDCPHGCGELVAATELSSHLDLHVAEDIALEDSGATSVEQEGLDGRDYKFDELLEEKYGLAAKSERKDVSRAPQKKKKNRVHSPEGHDTAPAGSVKRLGVCASCQTEDSTDGNSEQNWVRMHMRRKCHHG